MSTINKENYEKYKYQQSRKLITFQKATVKCTDRINNMQFTIITNELSPHNAILLSHDHLMHEKHDMLLS